MEIIDITGKIADGMWNYKAPFPRFKRQSVGNIPWVSQKVYSDVFEGMHSQTGTYLETPAHFFGYERSYSIADIPLDKLVDIPCTLMKLDMTAGTNGKEKKVIGLADLERMDTAESIFPGGAILISTGWSEHWFEEKFTEESPYFTYEAMMWLIAKKPFLLGSDFPCWDSAQNPQGFFGEFYSADILMLGPCDRLSDIKEKTGWLTALPLNIQGACASSCRAFLKTN